MNIKVGKQIIEVYPKDAIDSMPWNDAVRWCESLGKGWRLPTKDELNVIYENKDATDSFVSYYYWSSSETSNNSAWVQSFDNSYQYNSDKSNYRYVRAVKNVIEEE